MAAFIHQPGGIVIILNGNSVHVAKTDKVFVQVVKALADKESDQAILDIINFDKIRMERATEFVDGVTLKGSQLYFQDEPIAGVLGERMVQMLDEGFDLTPMTNFLNNLLKNPSRRVVEHLYAFLEVGKCAITEDGCFLVYKAVKANYTDIRTGKFDNTVGSEVTMPRHRVDEDPDRTCSRGLHVCSFEYLPHFAHDNGHVVVCKVNPADVVAIPRDYNNTKMRVWRYIVVDEVKNYYEEHKDLLASVSVRSDQLDAAFSVEVRLSGERHFEEVDTFDSLLDAAMCMKHELERDRDDLGAIRVVNTLTDTVVDEKVFDANDSTFIEEEDDHFTLWGLNNGESTSLGGEFDSVQEAVMASLDYTDEYSVIEIREADGVTVVKTIS